MSSTQQWADADAAAVQLNDYFSDLAARRRAESRDDLMSALVAISDASDGRLSDSELLDNLTLLLVAGFETAALARLEAGVAFPRLLAGFPELQTAGDPERKNGIVLRGYETLPVRTRKSRD